MGSFLLSVKAFQWQPCWSQRCWAVGSVGSQVCQEGSFSPGGFFRGPEVSEGEIYTWVPRTQLSYIHFASRQLSLMHPRDRVVPRLLYSFDHMV